MEGWIVGWQFGGVVGGRCRVLELGSLGSR